MWQKKRKGQNTPHLCDGNGVVGGQEGTKIPNDQGKKDQWPEGGFQCRQLGGTERGKRESGTDMFLRHGAYDRKGDARSSQIYLRRKGLANKNLSQ